MENQNFLSFFGQNQSYFVRQVKEWGEILTGFETKNKYQILDANNQPIGFCAEQGSGFWAFIKRSFLRAHRPLTIHVFDREGNKILELDRPYYWFFSSMYVKDANGKNLGHIEQKFAIFRKRYELLDHAHKVFARIDSGFFKFFSFEIFNNGDKSIGLISKKWGGIFKEIFTDSDTFGVQLTTDLSPEQKAIIFANALSIDFDYFEENANRDGIF
ncbi:phospholipid scramblase-related protein [Bacteriovorax sp. Seq25_V]|uniref:phospholipid scramblase-related protein n=1 Tax=Bacteriovorax sp. Seq25_V TaxID=1201288 RepID=UPI00038A3ACD|nr:phospholipid scramblase-related protein [Bacteriovorax sp. Seq25_V]EQC47215.1 scramblase [Bacteriovorax sp. Seq25_V]